MMATFRRDFSEKKQEDREMKPQDAFGFDTEETSPSKELAEKLGKAFFESFGKDTSSSTSKPDKHDSNGDKASFFYRPVSLG
ncbi:hypothetical protein [Sansalvadorimonas verongulae]|uniref:hypothetical protein n=1 Tax=Sansalvadorimonas verongulae TaxID=2172824 RepID=UPI0012BC7CF2|nr:hypothetical protein [Sansalvadorimonas verongulae]MTI12754.1 hypothetical protein [Sansalvadorimonas verongulae]